LKIINQKVIDIHHAIRMQDHIINTHCTNIELQKSELSKINDIVVLIDYINEQLRLWSKIEDKDKLFIQQKIIEAIQELKNFRNDLKVKAREQLEMSCDIKDSRNRTNPGAILARMVSALDRLTERINEIGFIDSSIALRKQLLLMEKSRIKNHLENCRTKIHAFLSQPTLFHYHYLAAMVLKDAENALDHIIYEIQNIFISPYYEKAKQVNNLLHSAKTELRKKDFINVKIYLSRAETILK